MSDMTPEKAQALLDAIEVDRLAVTSRAMGTVCDAKGWQTSTARHHRKVADTLEAQAAELTRLRAREYKLAALLNRAREELYMIRMKDSGAVYDVTLRMELADALSAYEEALE